MKKKSSKKPVAQKSAAKLPKNTMKQRKRLLPRKGPVRPVASSSPPPSPDASEVRAKILALLSSSDVAAVRLGCLLMEADDAQVLVRELADGLTCEAGVLMIPKHAQLYDRCKAVSRFSVALKVLALTGAHRTIDSLSFASPTTTCPVVDLEPLRHYSHLKALDLSLCEAIEDISPLTSCPSLTSLSLAGCRSIKDFSPIAALTKLESLDLASTAIEGQALSRLGALRSLRHLSLDAYLSESITNRETASRLMPNRHPEVDAETIAKFASLRSLSLAGRTVANLQSLPKLRYLETLSLERSSLRDDPTPLVHCASLLEINVRQCSADPHSHAGARGASAENDQQILAAIKKSVAKRRAVRSSVAGTDAADGSAVSAADRKKLDKMLKSGDAGAVVTAVELVTSLGASCRDKQEIFPASILKKLIGRWDAGLWAALVRVTSDCPPLDAVLAEVTSVAFGRLAQEPQNAYLNAILSLDPTCGEKFLGVVRGVLKKHFSLDIDTLTVNAAAILAAHKGWYLCVSSARPLTDEVVEALSRFGGVLNLLNQGYLEQGRQGDVHRDVSGFSERAAAALRSRR
jgi:hypothetical protein